MKSLLTLAALLAFGPAAFGQSPCANGQCARPVAAVVVRAQAQTMTVTSKTKQSVTVASHHRGLFGRPKGPRHAALLLVR